MQQVPPILSSVDDSGAAGPTTEAPVDEDTIARQMEIQQTPLINIVQKHFLPPPPNMPQTMATA
jgi:hypothetical protein